MQRQTVHPKLCASNGCTLPQFHSTGFCANHASIAAIVGAVDAELAPPIAAPGKKRDQARARRKSG
jgi:hypothetical protein